MDESRKQFVEIYEQMKHDRFGSNENLAWKFWHASREAIEICIPKPIEGFVPGDYHIGYDAGCESQWESDIDAIRAAGIKVKE